MPPNPSNPDIAGLPAGSSHHDHPAHGDWLARRLGAELRRLRAELGMSAYELAVPGVLSDQAILNNERGQQNAGIKTLVRHCQRLGTTLQAVLDAAMGGGRP